MIWDILKAFFEAGIRGVRDVREVKKTELEIEKLEEDKRGREGQIKTASFDDIKLYDEKISKLYKDLNHRECRAVGLDSADREKRARRIKEIGKEIEQYIETYGYEDDIATLIDQDEPK